MRRRIFLSLAVAAAFFAGLSADHVARAARKEPSYRPLDVFAEVLAHVQNSYVEEIPEKRLVYGAVDGLVSQLDPHSAFMRPEIYREVMEEATGEFDGVGLDLTVRGDQLTVVSPIPDSPAERAGILPGDRILEIDGVSTRDLSLLDASRKLRGAPGTKVALRIQREGSEGPRPVTLLRGRIRTRSAEMRIADEARGLAYVRIKGFQDGTDGELRRALEEARGRLHREIQGLVLDLRNNPGGLVEQAVLVSDRFLREGIIVITEGRGGANRVVETAKEKGTEPPYPLVVLVNRGSASASEIVAGALQDHGRALILGSRTFGKGSVQTLIELADHSGLKLTNARYYTPRHRSIQDQGIQPDVAVADPTSPGEDPQLQAALDRLRTWPASRPAEARRAAPGK